MNAKWWSNEDSVFLSCRHRDEIGQYILRAGQEQELRVFVRIANRLEDAHETILTILVPEYLKYRGTNVEVSYSEYFKNRDTNNEIKS